MKWYIYIYTNGFKFKNGYTSGYKKIARYDNGWQWYITMVLNKHQGDYGAQFWKMDRPKGSKRSTYDSMWLSGTCATLEWANCLRKKWQDLAGVTYLSTTDVFLDTFWAPCLICKLRDLRETPLEVLQSALQVGCHSGLVAGLNMLHPIGISP